jgi:hypothetical protein
LHWRWGKVCRPHWLEARRSTPLFQASYVSECGVLPDGLIPHAVLCPLRQSVIPIATQGPLERQIQTNKSAWLVFVSFHTEFFFCASRLISSLSVARIYGIHCLDDRWMIYWKGFGRKLRWPNWFTVLEFSRRGWRKPLGTSVRIPVCRPSIEPKFFMIRVLRYSIPIGLYCSYFLV